MKPISRKRRRSRRHRGTKKEEGSWPKEARKERAAAPRPSVQRETKIPFKGRGTPPGELREMLEGHFDPPRKGAGGRRHGKALVSYRGWGGSGKKENY
jgi:hypothetical protein